MSRDVLYSGNRSAGIRDRCVAARILLADFHGLSEQTQANCGYFSIDRAEAVRDLSNAVLGGITAETMHRITDEMYANGNRKPCIVPSV